MSLILLIVFCYACHFGVPHSKVGCPTFWDSEVGRSQIGCRCDSYPCITVLHGLTGCPLWKIKRCGIGPWLVLVSLCFSENVVATCRIGSFLCSLDNLLQKNVIVLFFGNQISKWRSFEKRAIFYLLFTFFSYQGKVTKLPSHISLTYIHVFCSPYWLFYLTNFEQNMNLSDTVLFGMSPGVDSYSRHFGTINK